MIGLTLRHKLSPRNLKGMWATWEPCNVGYKFNKNQVLSIYGRNDLHKITDENQTYKINFTQFLNKFKLGATHSTGLKNPGLYELYGSSSWHTGSESVDPSKSRTNELYTEYKYSNNISFNLLLTEQLFLIEYQVQKI